MRYFLLCLTIFFTSFKIQAQSFSWAKQMGGSNATANTAMGQIKIDAAGNLFHSVSANSPIDVDPGPGVFNFTGGVVKLGPAGNFIWAKQIPGSYTIDGAGNIYSTGSFKGTVDFDPGPGVSNLTSFGYDDIFILKFDVSGNLIWAKQVGGSFMERGGGITLSLNGIIITGGFGYGGNISAINSCDFDPDPATTYSLTNVGGWDGFLLTLNPDGQFVSVLQKGTTADESIGNICVDNNGNFIYHTGNKLEKSDPNLNPLWSIDISGISWAMAPFTVDVSGNILISGGYMGTFDIDPGPGVTMVPSVTIGGSIVQAPFVEKFDANGNFMWVKTITANGFANGVTSDASGNVYTVGYFNYNGNVDFDPGPGAYNFKVSALAGYVQKLSAAGNFIWATKVGGESKTDTKGRAIAVNNSNQVFTALEFKGTIDVDPGSGKFNLTAKGPRDVVFHKMTQPNSGVGAYVNNDLSNDDLQINPPLKNGKPGLQVINAYPNPNKGNFYVEVPAVGNNAQLIIYDMQGRTILSKAFNGQTEQKIQVNLPGTSSGKYFVEAKGSLNNFKTKVSVQ